jgi:hypothetical protein
MTDRAALLGAERSPLQVWRGTLAWSLGAAFYFYEFVHRVSPSIDELLRDFAASGAVVGYLLSAGPSVRRCSVGSSAHSLSSSRWR